MSVALASAAQSTCEAPAALHPGTPLCSEMKFQGLLDHRLAGNFLMTQVNVGASTGNNIRVLSVLRQPPRLLG